MQHSPAPFLPPKTPSPSDPAPHLPTPQAWQQLTRDVLRPEQPFELHQSLHAAVFAGWDDRVLGPPPVWVPSADVVAGTNLAAFMDRFEVRGCGCSG